MTQNFNLYLSVATLVMSFSITGAVIFIANKYNVFPKNSFRRKKSEKVPLLGGLSIYLSLLATNIFLGSEFINTILLVALPLVLLGVLDDILEFSAKPKFIAQLIAGSVLVALTPHEQLIFAQVGFGELSSGLLVVFTVLLVSNAINFIDGADGLASSISFICIFGFFLIGACYLEEFLLLGASILGFLAYNKYPARIYLGDSGSSLLGVMLACLTVGVPPASLPSVSLVAILFLLATPLADMMLAIIRRLSKGLSPFKGDQDHIHHKLLKVGFSEKQVLMVNIVITSTCLLTSYSLYRVQDGKVAMAITGLAAVLLCFNLFLIYFTELKLGLQVSKYGKTLIDKYLQQSEVLQFSPKKFHAVVYDLLPYYKELQIQGLPVVDSFVRDFAAIIDANIKTSEVAFIGSYSVAVIYKDKSVWEAAKKQTVKKNFYHLTEKYNVVKSYSDTPDGLHFYSTMTAKQFIWLLDVEGVEARPSAA